MRVQSHKTSKLTIEWHYSFKYSSSKHFASERETSSNVCALQKGHLQK